MKKIILSLCFFCACVFCFGGLANVQNVSAQPLSDVEFVRCKIYFDSSLSTIDVSGLSYSELFGFTYNSEQYLKLDTVVKGDNSYYYFECKTKYSDGIAYKSVFTVYSSRGLAVNLSNGQLYFFGYYNDVVSTMPINSSNPLYTVMSKDDYNSYYNAFADTGFPHYYVITLKTLTEGVYAKKYTPMFYCIPTTLSSDGLDIDIELYDYVNTFDDMIDDEKIISYNQGYSAGYNEGINGDISQNWLMSVLDTVFGVLDLEIFPTFKLGYFLFIPIGLGVLFFLLKIGRG